MKTLVAALSLVLLGCTPASTTGSTGPNASAVPAQPADACAPWGGRGFKVSTDSFAATPASRVRIDYDDATGKLSVHRGPGDPTASDKKIELSAADRETLARDFLAMCPSEKERAERCAPGGCSRIDVQPRSGPPQSLENGEIARKVATRLESFFPELRSTP